MTHLSEIFEDRASRSLAGVGRALDREFAAFVGRAADSADPTLATVAMLASAAVAQGHTCLDLAAVAGGSAADASWGGVPTLPPLAALLAALRTPPARRMIGGPEDDRPLVLDGMHLYLRRYWNYQRTVTTRLLELAAERPVAAPLSEERLAAVFPIDAPACAAACLPPRAAARNAAARRLAILSGGPGTGKTYTLARIVALLADASPPGGPLRVRIAAPTGKAAARAAASLCEARARLAGELRAETLAALPTTAGTLHRLLDALPRSPYFRHDRDHPLAADLVVVDEASMVDLPMMARLLDALPPDGRLLLVGDRHQLASVEPGRVYGDLCEAALDTPRLRPCLAELRFSHRSRESPDLTALAELVREGAPAAWPQLCASASAALAQHPPKSTPLRHDAAFRAAVQAGFAALWAAGSPRAALAAAGRFRVLCAVRGGPLGVETVNREIESVLADMDGPDGRRLRPRGRFYTGRLVMVTVNDAAFGVFNGDVGVLWRNAANDAWEVWFESGTVGTPEEVRCLPAALLPPHETAFALTVHKSQGSEFDRVALVLPAEENAPALTRELLYTGITRARHAVGVWATEAAFRAALTRRTQRVTGLAAALRAGVRP